MCDAVQHLVGGDVVEHQRHRLAGIDSRGHGIQLLHRQDDVLAVAPIEGKGRDSLPGLQSRGVRAQSLHYADNGVTGSERRPRAARIAPAPDVHIGEPHVGSQDLDEYLPADWRRQLVLDDLQNLRPSGVTNHYMSVFHDLILPWLETVSTRPFWRRTRPASSNGLVTASDSCWPS